MRRNSKSLLKVIAIVTILFLLYKLLVEKTWHPTTSKDSIAIAISKTPKYGDLTVKNLPLEKKSDFKDWHDYARIEADLKRTGEGEQGIPVTYDHKDEAEVMSLYNQNGFNAFVSDTIDLNRSLRDLRHKDCKKRMYLTKLPTASIVIPFHQEHITTLSRSVQSIINRSPPELLHEVILVDDFSDKDFLQKPVLEDYCKEKWGDKVKIVRAGQREGLIRARLLGAKVATGDVIIFLDSHVECTNNWLPPLLEPIAINSKTVVCPFIDIIDYDTFEYRIQDNGARGAFDWELFYKRLPRHESDKTHPTDPFESPVMAGGLFAIDREWFWTLGGYDPGLEIWGGEQYELSFKIWQCGGSMVDAPCSRVGHIYRKYSPFKNNAKGDFVAKNYKRVAEVWMDEYAEFIYKRKPYYRNVDMGDITAQLAIRNKLKCKSFDWFIKRVMPDIYDHYPPIEPANFAEGMIRNKDYCIVRLQNKIGVAKCDVTVKTNYFIFTWHKDIRIKNMCFDVPTSYDKSPVTLFECHGMKGNQRVKYDTVHQQIFHPHVAMCLTMEFPDVFMSRCQDNNDNQKWLFDTMNSTALDIDFQSP